MAQATVQRFLSTKPVKDIKGLISDKRFILPRSFANDGDPDTGKPIVLVYVNSKRYNLYVEEEIDIPYEPYCVLKDSSAYRDIDKYDMGGEFDPFYENKK